MADLIDFEALLSAAQNAADSGAAIDQAAADRRLFTEQLAPRLGARSSERREVFHAWVEAMRSRSLARLPGATYEAGRHAAQALALGLGGLCGIGLCSSLLSHDSAEPINALLFLGATVGLQLGLVVLVALAWAARRAGWRAGPGGDALLALVVRAGGWLRRQDGERRDSLRAALARLQRRSSSGAALLQCQLLIVTQLFAIAFNLGILGAMLLVYLPFVELRFGWQSTYSIGAGAMHHAVQWIAAPWHWIAADLAPSAQQVAASQYARGQGAPTLPAEAAHAWWPFLLCAVAVYGLLLRSAIALAAAVLLRRRLARIGFQQPEAHALWRRLHGPLVSAETGGARLPEHLAAQAAHGSAPGTALLVLADESPLDAPRATALAERQLGWRFERCLRAGVDDDRLPPALADALRSAPAGIASAVVVVVPATLDPIVAVAGFLRALGRPGSELLLLLTGPLAGEGLASVPPERLAIWRRFVAIQGLQAGVERAA